MPGLPWPMPASSQMKKWVWKGFSCTARCIRPALLLVTTLYTGTVPSTCRRTPTLLYLSLPSPVAVHPHCFTSPYPHLSPYTHTALSIPTLTCRRTPTLLYLSLPSPVAVHPLSLIHI